MPGLNRLQLQLCVYSLGTPLAMIVSISNEVILIIAYYGSMTKILQLHNIERIEGDNGIAVPLDRHPGMFL
jgi:hypothetical protein